MVKIQNLSKLFGEWVIKLKSNKVFQETMKVIGAIWLRVILYVVISIIFFEVVIDNLLEKYLANTTWNFSPEFYYFCVSNKSRIFFLYLVVMISIALYRYLSKKIKNEHALYNSLEKVLDEENTKIELPTELVKYSEKLNEINYEYVLSKKKAKEEEQKKNDLIMYMAHDLKTPLTSLIGYLTLLNDEKEISKELQEKYLKIALDKSLRLENLTNQFFEITRYNLKDMPLNKADIDLSILLDQLIDEFYPIIEKKNLELKVSKPKSLMYHADGDKLARAFSNLIKNAISYSYENTVIEIIVKQNENSIEVIFKNKGDTIPEYKLEKIFDKFYRADNSRATNNGGAGLGLAITKEIIELHGGTIIAKSQNEEIQFVVKMIKNL